jgi:flagellar hook-associated protein 1 FlgK
MSLNIALQYAVSGLNATQSQLQVLAGNIANAQTPGYSEETLPQTADAATNGGAGVVTGEIQRVTDQSLQKSLLEQTTQSGGASATSNYQQQVQDLLGQVGSGNSLADYLDGFTSAMQTVAATPQDPSAQASAVNAGQQLASALNNLSSGIQTLRQNADSQIGTDVGIVNTALSQIAQLNGQISKLQALGESTATLDDQRDQQLTTVAQYIGVQSYTASDGTMSVLTTSGQNLVTADTAQQFSYTPSGTVTAQTTLSSLTIEGTNVTADTTTGEIGALLQTENTTLPNLTAQLNQVTNNLFAESSDANLATTNSGLGATNDANDFFAAVDIANGVDNAATIQVNPDLVSNPGLLDQDSNGDPDPSITATLLSNFTGATSFAAAGGIPATSTPISNYAAQLIGASATAASSASATATDQSSLLAQMQSEYSNSTGVDLDTELSKLVIYQNAYGASARVISTIQSMFDSLMAVSI